MTSCNACNRKPKMTLGKRANLVVAALVILLVQVLMVVGNLIEARQTCKTAALGALNARP